MGYSVLNNKEKTTIERDIKQILKDVNNDLSSSNSNRDSQVNGTQSSLSSSTHNKSNSNSMFNSFLSSVAVNSISKRTVPQNSDNTNAIADEFLLYKSLATKEVSKITEQDLNPDPPAFW